MFHKFKSISLNTRMVSRYIEEDFSRVTEGKCGIVVLKKSKISVHRCKA